MHVLVLNSLGIRSLMLKIALTPKVMQWNAGAYLGFSEGGGPRSTKQANNQTSARLG